MAILQAGLVAEVEVASSIPDKRVNDTGAARSMLLTVFTNFAIAGAALVSGPLAARLLGPVGRGELAAVQNIYWLTAYASLLGLAEGTLFFVARTPSKSGRVLATSASLVMIAAPVCMLVGYFLAPWVLGGHIRETVPIAQISLMFIWVQSLLALVQFALRGRNLIFQWNISRAVPAALWTLLLVVFGLRGDASVSAIMYAYISILSVSIFVGLALFMRKQPDTIDFRPDFSLTRPLLRYGGPLVCASVPQTLNLRLDQLLIAGMLPASSLGFYVVAVGWSGAITPLLAAIANILFPKLAASISLEDSALVFGRVIRISGIVAVLLGGLLAAITPVIVPLMFGEAFRSSVFPAYILIGASIISGMNIILEEGLRGLASTWAIFFSEGLGLIATGISLIYFLPRYGIVGAAIGSVLGYSVTAVALSFQVLRSLRTPWVSFFMPRRDDFNYFWNQTAALFGRLTIRRQAMHP
jgi:antigen flippase